MVRKDLKHLGISESDWYGAAQNRVDWRRRWSAAISKMRQGRPVLLEVLFVQCVTETFQERVTRPNISAWMKEESL